MKFARYEAHREVAYGIVEGDSVHQISAAPWEDYKRSDHSHPLDHVKILAPCTPYIVFFMGGNYYDHLGDAGAPEIPQVYTKDAQLHLRTRRHHHPAKGGRGRPGGGRAGRHHRQAVPQGL